MPEVKNIPQKVLLGRSKHFATVQSRAEAMKLERKLKNFKSNKKLNLWISEVVGSEKLQKHSLLTHF